MGDGRILLKPRRDDSFKKAYRMSLLSAGSISLDSTFNVGFLDFLDFKLHLLIVVRTWTLLDLLFLLNKMKLQ